MKQKGFTYFIALGVALVAAAALIISESGLPNASHSTLEGQSELRTFRSEADVANFLTSNNGGNSRNLVGLGSDVQRTTAVPAAFEASSADASSKSGAVTATDYSSTNIQVEGVDEADFVKNDGKYIYSISGSNIVITEAYPADSMKIVSIINMSKYSPQEIYINDNRLVVFGNIYNYYDYGDVMPMEKKLAAETTVAEPGAADSRIAIWPGYGQSTTYMKVYDVSDRSNPVLKRTLEFNGTYYDSRMIGDQLYFIVNTQPYYVGGGIRIPTFSPTQVVFPEIYYFDIPDYSYQFTNIISADVNADSGEVQNKVFLLGYSTSMYVSADNIYLVYPKRVNESYRFDRIIDEIIIPAAPSDVSSQISSIRSSDRPYYQKESDIQNVLQNWMGNMNPEQAANLQKNFEEKYQMIQDDINKELGKSVVHKISISNGNIEYRTKGEVPGHPLNQFSMDEHNGYFRIATTLEEYYYGGPIIMPLGGASGWGEVLPVDIGGGIGSTLPGAADEPVQSDEPIEKPVPMPEPSEPTVVPSERPMPVIQKSQGPKNNVYILDGSMNVVGKLENLAPGERIYSARFMGERAYLVTFKRVDPLFVLDLSNPSNPTVLGELKIPGYSDYLHPYDENHLIGIGKDVDASIDADKVHESDAIYYTAIRGLKLSLFDVSDVAHPVETSKFIIGDRGTESEALYDHKALLFDKEKNLLVLPVTVVELKTGESYGYPSFQGAYVFNIDLQNGFTYKNRITHFDKAKDDEQYYYYYGPYSVTRSLYMDDTLYTISTKEIKANNLGDLSEISSVTLPGIDEIIYRIL